MKQYIILVILLVIAFLAGRFASPKKTEIKEVEKIVIQKEEKKNDNRSIRVETQETVLPDGTKTVHTISQENSSSEVESRSVSSNERSKTSKIDSDRPQWSIGLYTDKETIDGSVDRRILGGLFIGIHGHSELSNPHPKVGLGLRLEL